MTLAVSVFKSLSGALWASLLVLACVLPTATAQTDGCEQANPCPWIADVEDLGFLEQSPDWEFTMGDWYEISVMNHDVVEHVVTLSGYGITLTVPADEEATAIIHFTVAGEFTISDEPSGDELAVIITEEDSIENDNFGDPTPSPPAPPTDGATVRDPAPSAVLLGLSILASAALVMRRLG